MEYAGFYKVKIVAVAIFVLFLFLIFSGAIYYKINAEKPVNGSPRTSCISNLRAVLSAVRMYEEDYGEVPIDMGPSKSHFSSLWLSARRLSGTLR